MLIVHMPFEQTTFDCSLGAKLEMEGVSLD